jgi:hypothetical protein
VSWGERERIPGLICTLVVTLLILPAPPCSQCETQEEKEVEGQRAALEGGGRGSVTVIFLSVFTVWGKAWSLIGGGGFEARDRACISSLFLDGQEASTASLFDVWTCQGPWHQDRAQCQGQAS